MEATGIIVGLIFRSRKFQDCCGIAMQAKLAGKTRRLRAAWRAKVLVWGLGVLVAVEEHCFNTVVRKPQYFLVYP